MRTLIIGLVCIATINGKPLSDRGENISAFKYPGGAIPGNFLEAREPDNLNGIYNKGGLGMGKTKREDKPAESGSGSGSQEGSGNPVNQVTQFQTQLQNMMNGGFPPMGGHMPFLGQSKKSKREDKPAESSSGSGSQEGSGNPVNQVTQFQTQLQNMMNGGFPPMGGHMPFLGQSQKSKREDKPAESGSGSGSQEGSGNPVNQVTQFQTQLQNMMNGGFPPMGGHMPFLGQSQKSKREDKPAESGSGSGSQGGSGNPVNQVTQFQTQLQSMMNGGFPPMGGHMPFLSQSQKSKREDKPAESGSGSGSQGGSGNPVNQVTQFQTQLQSMMNGGFPPMGGHMPFLSQSQKSKREDKPAESGSGSGSQEGSGNPVNQVTQFQTQLQNMMNGGFPPIGGHMPFLDQSQKSKREDKPAESGSGSGSQEGSGNPVNQVTQFQTQLQNMMNGGFPPMGSHMPFLGQSQKSKREDKPAESGSGSGSQEGSGNPVNQVTQFQTQLQNMMNGGFPPIGGHMPFLDQSQKSKREDKPAESGSGSGSQEGSGNPVNQVTQFQTQLQNMMNGGFPPIGGHMPFLDQSQKSKREDKPAESGSGSGSQEGSGNPVNQVTQFQTQLQNMMNGGFPPIGGHMPFLDQSQKSKREDKPAESGSGSGSQEGSGNPVNQVTQFQTQLQNMMNGGFPPMGSHMPFLGQSQKSKREDKPAESGSGSGSQEGSGNPVNQVTQFQTQLQNMMNGGFPPIGGHMPFLDQSQKSKREDKPAESGSGSGSQEGSGNPVNQVTQFQTQLQNMMNGGFPPMGSHMPFLGQSQKSKREDKPAESGSGSGSQEGSGNPVNQVTQFQTQLQNMMNGGFPPMGSHMPFLDQSQKSKREDKPAESGSGSGSQEGSGNPVNQVTQFQTQLQNMMNGGFPPMGGHMPFLGQSQKSKREDKPAESGSGSGSQEGSGNPVNQVTQFQTQLQNMMNGGFPPMGGHMPFLGQSQKSKREDKPAESGSGSGSQEGSGNPVNQVTQFQTQLQNMMNGGFPPMGGHMPFLSQSQKSKREDKPAESGSGSGSQEGSGNPVNQVTQFQTQLQNMMNGGFPPMGGHMPFLGQSQKSKREDKPAESGSGSGSQEGSGNPVNQVTQFQTQLQNMMNGGFPPMGGHMPFLQQN